MLLLFSTQQLDPASLLGLSNSLLHDTVNLAVIGGLVTAIDVARVLCLPDVTV